MFIFNPLQFVKVKALGVLAMIDEGETDWKVIVIDVNDPLAKQLNGLLLENMFLQYSIFLSVL